MRKSSNPRRARQLSLFFIENPFAVFTVKKGRRKKARLLSRRQAMHVVLKASHGIRKSEPQILALWNRLGKKLGIRTYSLVVAYDHIHGLIKIQDRKSYQRFIRALTGLLSLVVKIKWSHRPVTRLAAWGRDFKRLLRYLKLNKLEALGVIAYRPERTRGLPEWFWAAER